MPRRIHNERARAEAAVHISNRAVLHAQSGRWRESADAYLEAWQATSRRDPRSYFYIHGYSSIFREEHLAITPADLAALRAAGEVEEMPCVDRVMALFSLGLLRWTAVDRQGAARAYRKCIAVAASATREDRMFRIVNATDPNEMMTAWEEIDDICVQANQNLRALEQKPPDPSLGHAHPGSSSTPMSRLVSLGNLGVEGNRELDELLSVGGGTCDFCDRAPSADGLKLRRCSRCLLAWYCSPECQRNAWRSVHKKHCRLPGDVREGDKMLLYGLVARPEMNGLAVLVRAPDPTREGRWKVSPLGLERVLSIAGKNLQRLRPPKR